MAIVRQTLKQLRDTVLKDVTTWLQGMAEFRVSENTIYVRVGDVRSEWLLIPLDNMEDQRRLLSMQLTMGWLSEAIEMDVGIISPLAGRLGRYPGPNQGGASFFGLIADTNMPSEGSDWHKFMTQPAPDWSIFIQPGGMDEHAENLEWLTQTPETLKLPPDHPVRLAQGRTYYERFLRSNSPEWCTRYVHALYGPDPSGTAVFRESFKHSFHAVEDLQPVHGHPLVVGIDFGRDPCAVITQLDHRGRLLVLEEVIAEDIGLELQLQRALRPALQQVAYLGKTVMLIGDPAGGQKSTIYEETSFDVLKREGFHAYPAPTNNIDQRLRAVERLLLEQRDGGPAFLIDKNKCPTLVRAFDGGYRYKIRRNGARDVKPDKNEYSHVMDALQYACLAAGSGLSGYVSARIQRAARPRNNAPRFSAAAWT